MNIWKKQHNEKHHKHGDQGKHEQQPRPCGNCGGMGDCPNCGGTGEA